MVTRFFPSFIFFIAFLLAPLSAWAQTATLSFTPSTGTFPAGKTFTINVSVDSGSTAINSANATVTFDPSIISVDSVSKNGSAFGLWAVEPTFSNSQGTVSFEGGNTAPISGKKQLLSVIFKAIKEGQVTLAFKDGTVLAADGKGTNVLGDKLPSTYTIGASVAPPPTATPGGSSGGGQKPDIPEVTSTSHPDGDTWYATTTVVFAWENAIDVTQVRLVIDQKEDTVPVKTIDPAISEYEESGLKPGASWFHLRLKNEAGWGETAHKKFLIDSTPPEPFTALAKADPNAPDAAILEFSATDTLSGIERYEISSQSGEVKKLKPTDIPATGFIMTGLSAGVQNFKVFAFDKAGNKQEAAASVSVVGPPPPTTKPGEEEEKPSVFTGSYILSLILAALVAFLVAFLIYERRVTQREKWKAKREADEIREKLETIFSVLRQEIDEQITLLAQKPNPSPQDREVQERLREALDISEELIDKEIEDVRKLLA